MSNLRSVGERTEAVAVRVMSTDDRRILSKSVIYTSEPSQALAISEALSRINGVQAIPVRSEFDVFGKRFFVENRD